MIAAAPYGASIPRTKTASAISMPGVVGGYFALRFCITFLFFQADPQTGALVCVSLNILLLLPVVIYAAGKGTVTLRQMLKVLPFRFVLGFIGLALVSLLWSVTPSAAVALGYWSAMVSDVLLVLLLVHVDGTACTAESMLKGFVCGVFLVCLIAWCSPVTEDLRLGDYDYLTPNLIGFDCAFGLMLCQHFSPQGARWKWLGVAFALTLLRTISKTSIIALIVAESFYLVRTRTIKREGKVLILAAAAFLALAFSGLFLSYYTIYTTSGGQAETLTGRTGIWLATAALAVETPWLGHGFHSFRSTIPAFGAFEPWHAHNELLQQFFTYGVAGVALLVGLYVSFHRLCQACQDSPWSLTCRALLLMVLVRGLADTERFDLSFPLWSITALSLAMAERANPLAEWAAI